MPTTTATMAATATVRSRALGAVVRATRAPARLVVFASVLLLTVVGLALCRALLLAAPAPAGSRLGVEVTHWFMRFGAWVFGVRVSAQGPLPPSGALLVANHRSYLDAVALASVVRATFLAKHEVSRWPIIGAGARLAGVVFVARDSSASRRIAADELLTRLGQGSRVVNFPEGTTSVAADPLPFRPGLFRRVAGLPIAVVPLRIDYADAAACWVGDDEFLGHLVKTAARRHTIVRLRFGSPIDALATSASELQARCREQITEPA